MTVFFLLALSLDEPCTTSSVNEVICHGIPDQRKLKEGDIVNLGQSIPHPPRYDH